MLTLPACAIIAWLVAWIRKTVFPFTRNVRPLMPPCERSRESSHCMLLRKDLGQWYENRSGR